MAQWYSYYGGYDDTINNFKAGPANWDSDVLYVPNGVSAERKGNTLYIYGNNGGTLTVNTKFSYTDTFRYTSDGYTVWNAAIADSSYGYDTLWYESDVNVYLGNGTTDLWLVGEGNKDIRLDDTSTGKYYIAIKDITAFSGDNILWGNNLNNYIIDGAGNSNLWGGWEGDDTLSGGEGSDCFLYHYNGGHDVITNASNNDTIFIFNANPGDVSYSYDSENQIMNICAGDNGWSSSWLEVHCSTGDEYFPTTYPVYQFADGSRWTFTGFWSTISWDTAQDLDADIATNPLWGNANTFSGTDDADNFFLGKSDGNDLISDAQQADTVHLYDAALSDIVATSVNDNSIAVQFNTGETAVVETTENISPTFKLASGESYIYNRENSSWQEV